MKWQQIGTLRDGVTTEFTKSPGVYMEIFPGKPKRIIYIGTTKEGFNSRPGGYWDHYLSMKHFAFKATTDDDIYSKGMCVNSSDNRAQYHQHLETMIREGNLWVPDWPGCDKDKWKEQEWKEFIEKNYSGVELWGYQISDQKTQEEVESRLQIALGFMFRIGYLNNGTRQNWLGQQNCRRSFNEAFNARNLIFNVKLNSANLSIDENALKAFDDQENKDLICAYFAQKDETTSPF